MQDISLNFVPLNTLHFQFSIFRKIANAAAKKEEETVARFRLPVASGLEEYEQYDIRWTPLDGYELFNCSNLDNVQLTVKYLHKLLVDRLTSGSTSGVEWREHSEDFIKSVDIIVNKVVQGESIISATSYYLKSAKQFGYILNNHFILAPGQSFDKEVQRLSYSLDSNYRPNRSFYLDKYKAITQFISSTFKPVFPLSGDIDIDTSLARVQSLTLNTKEYMCGNNKTSNSQFVGLMKHGPISSLGNRIQYVFAFTEGGRPLGRDIYLGLTGKLFPAQFKGMNEMFNVSFSKENVSHFVLKSLSKQDMDDLSVSINKVRTETNADNVLVVAIFPHETTSSNFDAYGYLKLLAIKDGFQVQAILQETMAKKEQLKWAISNIGLQIFSKLGGVPWLVKPRNDNCLIFGIGSAHEEDANGKIVKYVAYTVCLDASGKFKRVKPLAASDSRDTYIDSLKSELEVTLKDLVLNSNYTKCVLHVPFKVKKYELNAIREAVATILGNSNLTIRVIKINTKHRYFGFSDHNTKVPYESSYIPLSNKEYLIWTEGLQYGKESVTGRISGPIHIEFIHDIPDTQEDDKSYLQDIINLTGANWRGFNAKAQPISIYYASLIARFMKEFSHLTGEDSITALNKEADTPWFL